KQAVMLKNNRILIGGYDGLIEAAPAGDLKASFYPISGVWPLIAKNENNDVFVAALGKIWRYESNGILSEEFSTGIHQSSAFFIDNKNTFWITDAKNNHLYRFKNGIREKISI